MRPAQKAPENSWWISKRRAKSTRFNEAGAKSAGKRGAIATGGSTGTSASMRPAQKAPENTFEVRQQRLGDSALQ